MCDTGKGKEVGSRKGKGKGKSGSVRYRVDPKNASVVDNILNDKLSPSKQKDC